MLEELKNLSSPGSGEDIIFFLQSVVGKNELTTDDIRVICSHAPGRYQLAVNELLSYCTYFNFIYRGEYIYLDGELQHLVNSSEKMNDELIYRTVNKLFETEVFYPALFSYDFNTEKFVFKNERLPLCFSAVRNVLVSQSFFYVERNPRPTFYINEKFESIISTHCKKRKVTMTLDMLKKKLEEDAEAGDKAERYVLEYEKKRISNKDLSQKVRIISDIDVSAGYDIVSYNTNSSLKYDRFIEVKANSKNLGFYWSANEIEIAKAKGPQYFLYLVDLSKITDGDYEPLIISNPASLILVSSEWKVEPQTYHIRHI